MGKRGAAPGERRGGRVKGTPNKKTQKQLDVCDKFGITPLEYLMTVMTDAGEEVGRRVDAAKAAAQYVHPKLASTTTNSTHSFTESLMELIESHDGD